MILFLVQTLSVCFVVPPLASNLIADAGHHLLTKLLLPALLAGRETAPDHHARVITVASSAALLHAINWDALRDGPARRGMCVEHLYYQSKFVRLF